MSAIHQIGNVEPLQFMEREAYFLDPETAFQVKTGRTRRKIREGIQHRRVIADSVIEALELAVSGENDCDPCRALAHEMLKCNALTNHVIGRDLHGDDGSCYDGRAMLCACNSQLCPHCQKVKRGRSYRLAKKVIATIRPRVGENWRLLTLTLPSMPGLAMVDSIRFANRCFELLRKRKVFVSVAAGVKGVEVVPKPERLAFHTHLHVVILSRYIPQAELVSVWQDIVSGVAAKGGVEIDWEAPVSGVYSRVDDRRLMILTTAGGPIVDIRKVRRKDGERGISEDKAISEVVKYAMKSQDLALLWPEALRDIAKFEMTPGRWPRMVERLGAAREVAIAKEAVGEAEGFSSLDVMDVFDGEPGSEKVASVGNRRPSLKQLFAEGSMSFEEWTNEVDERWEAAYEFRREQLRRRFPGAVFEDLAGNRWGGG